MSCNKSTPIPNDIPSIQICGQIWMTKNLDLATYRNGDPIPEVTDSLQWAALTTGAWCYYNNDPTNEAVYGKLYNWYAVNDPRDLAPSGWHVPSDDEWKSLSACLGGDSLAGSKMKEAGTAHWSSPNTGATNSSGFTAVPNGWRIYDGTFLDFGTYCFMWTSTENKVVGLTPLAWMRFIYYQDTLLVKDYDNKHAGIAVRCIKG
jgi:uncharacterized protein (TIGR02145 family)